MGENPEYEINLDIAFDPLELIDVGRLEAECEHEWFNQSLCLVNDSVVRLGVLHGQFHWHRHDDTDEYFHVVKGRLLIDVEGGRTIELGPQQGTVVPKGVRHRPRAPERTVVLMVERETVKPTGDDT